MPSALTAITLLSLPFYPPGSPGSPRDVLVTKSASELTLQWTEGSTGNAPTTGYVIEARPSGRGVGQQASLSLGGLLGPLESGAAQEMVVPAEPEGTFQKVSGCQSPWVPFSFCISLTVLRQRGHLVARRGLFPTLHLSVFMVCTALTSQACDLHDLAALYVLGG